MNKPIVVLTAVALVVGGGIAAAQMQGMNHGNMDLGGMGNMAMMDHSAMIAAELTDNPSV